ncbi:hypothetical protein ElyMa_000145900 [Elysia marginata]|uniref:SMB domain-containing protein n=1 Tax=Elysia marginata TaxID=1093978 RepID=A0AAV4ER77_9GAST|nr:hypothetical protein ElyMa_000145900 [Elysia marginata]
MVRKRKVLQGTVLSFIFLINWSLRRYITDAAFVEKETTSKCNILFPNNCSSATSFSKNTSNSFGELSDASRKLENSPPKSPHAKFLTLLPKTRISNPLSPPRRSVVASGFPNASNDRTRLADPPIGDTDGRNLLSLSDERDNANRLLPTSELDTSASFSKSHGEINSSFRSEVQSLHEICSAVQQVGGDSCAGRCGSNPQKMLHIDLVTCGCDSRCRLYGDCCDDVATFCSSHLLEDQVKFPPSVPVKFVCFDFSKAIQTCGFDDIGFTTASSIQSTLSTQSFSTTPDGQGTFPNKRPSLEWRSEDVSKIGTKLYNILINPFLFVDESQRLLFEFEHRHDLTGCASAVSNITYIPKIIYILCDSAVFTMLRLTSMLPDCQHFQKISIPSSSRRFCCSTHSIICDGNRSFDPTAACQKFNSSDAYFWTGPRKNCIIRSVCRDRNQPPLEQSNKLVVATITLAENRFIRIDFAGLIIENSYKCSDTRFKVDLCVLDGCLSGAFLLVKPPPNIEQTRKKDNEERRRCLMPKGATVKFLGVKPSSISTSDMEPFSCECLGAFVAFGNLKIWRSVRLSGGICRIVLYKHSNKRETKTLNLTLHDSYRTENNRRRELYRFPELEQHYVKAFRSCLGSFNNSEYASRPVLICFILDPNYHELQSEPEVHAWGLDSSVGSGFAPWPRGRGFETQPSTVRAPTGWVGVSTM